MRIWLGETSRLGEEFAKSVSDWMTDRNSVDTLGVGCGCAFNSSRDRFHLHHHVGKSTEICPVSVCPLAPTQIIKITASLTTTTDAKLAHARSPLAERFAPLPLFDVMRITNIPYLRNSKLIS